MFHHGLKFFAYDTRQLHGKVVEMLCGLLDIFVDTGTVKCVRAL
jgi:hypothetical protein